MAHHWMAENSLWCCAVEVVINPPARLQGRLFTGGNSQETLQASGKTAPGGFPGTSLVAQWLGVRLPARGTRVRALVREDPTCRGAAGPVCHGYWACALEPASHKYEARWPRACAPQRERPPQ